MSFDDWYDQSWLTREAQRQAERQALPLAKEELQRWLVMRGLPLQTEPKGAGYFVTGNSSSHYREDDEVHRVAQIRFYSTDRKLNATLEALAKVRVMLVKLGVFYRINPIRDGQPYPSLSVRICPELWAELPAGDDGSTG